MTGIITITNPQEDTLIEIITKDSIEDENGYVKINYPDKEIKNIKMHLTKPVNLGELKIYNKKAIDSNTGYSKQELEKIQNLENTIKLNETTMETKMELLDTKTEAEISMENNKLSTLQNNENVQIMVTLLSNSEEYDLYKNPKVEITFPKELNINVKSISQLNLEEQIQIKEARLKENVLTLTLEGEQEGYINNANEGIQIAIIADISIGKTTPTKNTNIEVKLTNENKQGETQYPLKIQSKYGVLMLNKLENYNQAQETLETMDSQETNIELDTYSNEKIATKTIQIINNYEKPISEVSVIGTIEENNIDINFQNIILPENKNIKIYYSDNSNEWKENIEEVEKVKAYKIIFEDEIGAGELVEIAYSIHIPENLEPKSTGNIKNTLEYKYQENTETTISEIKCSTKSETPKDFSPSNTTNEQDGIKVEIMATSGGQQLKDEDTVKEGQGIRYKIRVTNETNDILSNINLEAVNTNAIYYNQIAYEENVEGVIHTKYKIAEDENLTSKQLEIGTLNPGETKEVSYQVSVKEVEDNNQEITGELKITADNYEEKIIQNITNSIEQGEIKATLQFMYSEDVLTCEGSGFPIFASVKNLSNKELQDIMVEIPLAEGLADFTEEDLFLDGSEPYEYIECKDRVIKFKIPKIEANQTVDITVKPEVSQVDIDKSEGMISQYFKVIGNGKEYISNDVERIVTQMRTQIIAVQTTNKKEKVIKDGEEIIFTIKIENKGTVGAEIAIKDKVPYGLKINSAKIKTNEKEEEMNRAMNLLVGHTMIKAKETIEVEINTTVDCLSMVEQEIENYVEINGININTESNKVSFTIELLEDNNNNNNNDDNNSDNNGDDNNGNNEDNNNPDFPQNDDNDGYSISGIAWIDTNSNGMQDEQEPKMANVQVWLINEETGDNLSERTKEDGSYYFKNVKQGNYRVMFQYDTSKYTITTYQKEGIPEDVNSDVISDKIKIQNQELPVARTKTLVINSQDLKNIDAGFVEGKNFDLKLDKTIKQVIIQTNKGTKVNSYNQTKLAKIEIDRKQIENSNIIIEYNIAITNSGEIAGYANEIIDYLPEDISFNQEINKSWIKLKDGSLSTKELSNQPINPGETKNITLTVSKKMTGENIGTITNKVKCEKQESQAELIVSIRTGRIILYISLVIVIISIIAIGVYFIKKKVL